VRVSREGEDPGNQVMAIREWASRNGVEVVSYYIDIGGSGTTKPRERPQYRAMLEVARALGIRLLLFYDLSRLSRSLEEGLLELKRLTEEGFDFKFVAQEFLDYIQDPVLRKKVIADFLWFAELYREDVRRRTVEGLRKARAEGKKLGRPPYPFPAEEVRRLLARGYSVAEVHRLLVLEGKVCREVGGRRECMRYETFRRRVRDILGKQKAGLGTTYRA